MFMAMFPELAYVHLDENTRKQLESSSEVRKETFERIIVGTNVLSVEVYQSIAAWLLKVPEENLKKLTFEDVENGAGKCFDESGYLA